MNTTTVVRATALRRSVSGCRAGVLARLYSTERDPQLGNYPQLPPVSRQWLPPRGWDDVQNRRNFGDTLHEETELYGMWGPDIPTTEPKVALRHMVMGFSVFGALATFLYLNAPEKHYTPRTPAQKADEYQATLTITGDTHH